MLIAGLTGGMACGKSFVAAALRDLLGSPERHRAMAAAARDVAMAHSWPAMAKQYLNLLQCAAARRATIAAPIADHAHA